MSEVLEILKADRPWCKIIHISRLIFIYGLYINCLPELALRRPRITRRLCVSVYVSVCLCVCVCVMICCLNRPVPTGISWFIVINLVFLLGSGRPADCKSVHYSLKVGHFIAKKLPCWIKQAVFHVAWNEWTLQEPWPSHEQHYHWLTY